MRVTEAGRSLAPLASNGAPLSFPTTGTVGWRQR
jgi:hypothetical protein